MAVVKILVLFLLLEKRSNLVNGQIPDYDYYPEESSSPPVRIPTDNELTHVRTKNLSGTVKLTTLQVLTTNRPDSLDNEFEDWNNLEETTSRSENKQYPQTENQLKVTLLSEVGTKAPTDGTESFTLMDVSNSTSGTLPDQSTEILITVTSQTLRLIHRNPGTKSITDTGNEEINVNIHPKESDFKEAPNPENQGIYSRVDEASDAMKKDEEKMNSNTFMDTDSIKVESQESIEDVSSFISVDEEILNTLSEEISYQDETIKDVDTIFKEFENNTSFENSAITLNRLEALTTTTNVPTEFTKIATESTTLFPITEKAEIDDLTELTTFSLNQKYAEDRFESTTLFSTTQELENDDSTKSTTFTSNQKYAENRFESITLFSTTQEQKIGDLTKSTTFTLNQKYAEDEFESETTPIIKITETTSFYPFEEPTLFTSKVTDVNNEEMQTTAFRNSEVISTTEDFETSGSPFTSKPLREYVTRLNPTRLGETLEKTESSKLENQLVFTSKPFYLSRENPVTDFEQNLNSETSLILVTTENFETTLSSVAEEEEESTTVFPTSTSTIKETEFTTLENNIATKNDNLLTITDTFINDVVDATISKEDLVTEYEKVPSSTTEMLKIKTDKVSVPIELTTEVKILNVVTPKNRIVETATKTPNNFTDDFVKLLSSGITYFMRSFIAETTTHRTHFPAVEITNKESQTHKSEENNYKETSDKRKKINAMEKRNSTEGIIWKHILRQVFNANNRSKDSPLVSKSKPILLSNNHQKEINSFKSVFVNSSKVEQTPIQSPEAAEIVAKIKEKIFKFSVNIIYNNTNFFVPSDAQLTQKSLNTYIIHWKSNSSMNSSIEINLGNFVNLNFVEKNQSHKTLLTKEVEKILLYNNSITLEDKVRIEFSNLDFLIKDEENEISPLTNALPSTPENSKTYVAEITGSCLGVFAVACVLVYYVMKKIKKETRNFKPNTNV